jgi:hypothetical protein
MQGVSQPVRIETVEEPDRVVRIAMTASALLEELQHYPLDDAGRGRVLASYQTAIAELEGGVSVDLQQELGRLTPPGDGDGCPVTDGELRIAQAQLVGWLNGLVESMRAAAVIQSRAADFSSIAEAAPSGDPGAATAYL